MVISPKRKWISLTNYSTRQLLSHCIIILHTAYITHPTRLIFSRLQLLYYLVCFYQLLQKIVLYICKLILISNQLLWYYINFDISVWINEKQCRSFIQTHTFINKFNLIYFVWLYCGVFADNNIAIWLGIPTVRTWLFGIFAECYFLGWLDPQSHPMTL